MTNRAQPAVAVDVEAQELLYDALEISGRKPPRSLEETRTFAEVSLAEAVRRKVRAEDASQILQLIDELFARAVDVDGVAVDVEVDHEAWADEGNPTATTQMAVVQRPVPVVVLGAGEAFVEKLTVCLGDDRVYAVAVSDEPAFRKAVFAYSPLIVLIDGTSPAAIEPRSLTAMLRGVPSSAMPVLWGSESGWARAVLPDLEEAGVPMVTLRREEGIEPLLDLVLARFRGDA